MEFSFLSLKDREKMNFLKNSFNKISTEALLIRFDIIL